MLKYVMDHVGPCKLSFRSSTSCIVTHGTPYWLLHKQAPPSMCWLAGVGWFASARSGGEWGYFLLPGGRRTNHNACGWYYFQPAWRHAGKWSQPGQSATVWFGKKLTLPKAERAEIVTAAMDSILVYVRSTLYMPCLDQLCFDCVSVNLGQRLCVTTEYTLYSTEYKWWCSLRGSLIHLPSQKYVDSGATGGDGQIRG